MQVDGFVLLPFEQLVPVYFLKNMIIIIPFKKEEEEEIKRITVVPVWKLGSLI